MSQGRYIVLEGPEGVGKTTQLQLLAIKLKEAGYPVQIFHEPDIDADLTTSMVSMLINDVRYPMNTRTEVLLYNAARSQSLDAIRKARDKGVICLCDRNYLTTLAIQYYGRGDVPDYQAITSIINFAVGDMQPDMTIVLDAPVKILRDRTGNRTTVQQPHNLDEAFLERVRAGYLWEANQRNYPVIFANNDRGKVAEAIWLVINDQIPATSAYEAAPPVSTNLTAPATPIREVLEHKKDTLDPPAEKNMIYVKKGKSGNYTITPEGKAFLGEAVTNANGDVYAFTDRLSPTTIAAAMAWHSRHGDDIRPTILEMFAGVTDKDKLSLQHATLAYNDDTAQQLIGQHLVIENASGLLAEKLERGRLASYPNRTDYSLPYDQKDKNGRYRYYVPSHLPEKIKTTYKQTVDAIFDLYSDMAHKLTDYVREHDATPKKERDSAWKSATRAQARNAILPSLPVATTSTVSIFASGRALESLIMRLSADKLPEAQAAGEAILRETRQTIGTFLEHTDKPNRGGAAIAYRANTYTEISKFAHSNLPSNLGTLDDSVQLVDYWPRNELDLLPHMLYEHSNMSLKDLKRTIDKWPYDQKTDAFHTYIGERLSYRHRPGRALEVARYTWDLICEYTTFRDVQQHHLVDGLEWQQLTPRYGFDIPELVEKAGLSDQFESCFDKSAELYSLMQAEGYELEAQYATLLGHRMRCTVTYNAREAFQIHELQGSLQGHPGYRKLVREMHDKLADVHPILAGAMKFVNKGEDEELIRLAAEKYTQFKLQQLQ